MDETLSACLFAEELVFFFSKTEGMDWTPGAGVCDISDEVTDFYHQSVAKAVHTTYKANYPDIVSCQEELFVEGRVNDHNDFARMALEAAPEYFPRGYTPETFVGFSAMVVGVGHLFHVQTKDEFFVDAAAGVLSTALIGFMLCGEFGAGGGWDRLVSVCGRFNRAHAAMTARRDKETGSGKEGARKI